MARQKRIAAKANTSGASKKKRKEKNKPDPKTPMKRVKVMGPTGKLRLEWHPW